MTFRTRRWPVALAALLFVAACGGTSPTTAPTTAPPAASTPPAASGSATPTGSGTAGSPSGSPSVAPTGSGTAGSPSVAPTGSGAAGSPQPGGKLIFAEWQPVSQLNPFFTTAFTAFESLGPALRGLLTINEAGQWTADLATEVPSVDNGGLVPNASAPADCTTSDKPTGDCFTLNVTLKPGYKWSDGKDLTLNDFKTTYDQARPGATRASAAQAARPSCRCWTRPSSRACTTPATATSRTSPSPLMACRWPSRGRRTTPAGSAGSPAPSSKVIGSRASTARLRQAPCRLVLASRTCRGTARSRSSRPARRHRLRRKNNWIGAAIRPSWITSALQVLRPARTA